MVSLPARKGFSVMEILIATVVAALAFATFLSVFRSSYQYASQTRNRAIATVLARSLLEEVEGHPYGAKAPANWVVAEDRPAQIWIEGKPVDTTFHKKVEFANSSFIGTTSDDGDVITISISWHENTGTDVAVNTGSADNHQLSVTVPVWR